MKTIGTIYIILGISVCLLGFIPPIDLASVFLWAGGFINIGIGWYLRK